MKKKKRVKKKVKKARIVPPGKKKTTCIVCDKECWDCISSKGGSLLDKFPYDGCWFSVNTLFGRMCSICAVVAHNGSRSFEGHKAFNEAS